MTTLFDTSEVREALFLILGGGLDDAGKMIWLSMRLAEGMNAEDIFADALRYITA